MPAKSKLTEPPPLPPPPPTDCARIASESASAVEIAAPFVTATAPEPPTEMRSPPLAPPSAVPPETPPPPPTLCARMPGEQPVPQVGSSPSGDSALPTPVASAAVFVTVTLPPAEEFPARPPKAT